MKKLFVLISMSCGLLIVEACSSVHKVNCYSTKTVPVTFITKSGLMYTINVPYCDTVKLENDRVPDSAKAEIRGF